MAPDLRLDPEAVHDVAQRAAALAIAADRLRDYAADDLLSVAAFGVLGERAGVLCGGLASRLADSLTAGVSSLDQLSAALAASADQARQVDRDARAGLHRAGR